MGDFMAVLGGYAHRHNAPDSRCFAGRRLHLLRLDCLAWVTDHGIRGGEDVWRGSFGHAASAVRNGTQMLVSGGYRGTVTKEVRSLSISSRSGSCQDLGRERCLSDPSCFWCGEAGLCADIGEADPDFCPSEYHL